MKRRRAIGVAILLVWVGALLLLWHRHATVSEAERLGSGALRLEPSTYYYALSQGGAQIGVASSAVDTSTDGMRIRDVFRGTAVIYGDSQTVTGSSTAYLTRSFVLDSFALSLGGDQGPYTLRGVPTTRSGVLLPTLVPIALMLSGDPTVGRSATYWVYNPISRRVERTTLAITAESLLTVVDSARFDAAKNAWVPAHSDTVRSWSVATPTASVVAWVDAEGRVVSAREPGGLSMTRTAYEVAYDVGARSRKTIAKPPRRLTDPK